MSSPFVAEIRIFCGNFAPRGWALCDGQLLPISQNTALFSLLGTTYGGDGKSTFALPNFQGMAPMFWGQGPGLSLHDIGETSGSPTVTLISSEIPAHTHTYTGGAGGRGNGTAPAGAVNSDAPFQTNIYAAASDGTVSSMVLPTASQPHENMSPYQTLNFIIALQGVFPARS